MNRKILTSCLLTWSLLAALFSIASLAPGSPAESKDPLPTPEEVLDGFVAATGGEAAYERLANRVTRARMELVGQGIQAAVTIHHARPNKAHTLLESDAFGTVESGFDGETAWELSAIAGPQIKDREERALILRASVFDAPVRWRDLFERAELLGIEKVDGRPCFKIALTPHEGRPEIRFYDRETNLLVKAEVTLDLPAGTIPMEVFSDTYKEVDGLLLAHRSRIVTLGQERHLVNESVEHNVELPPDRFALPAEIRALVGRRANPLERPGASGSETQ